MNKINKLFSIGIMLMVLLSLRADASGLSMGPVNLVVSGARGEEYTKTLFIFNPSNEETYIVLTAEGDAASWISFYDKESLEDITGLWIPTDSAAEVGVKFKIPIETAAGEYLSTIFAQTSAGEGQVGVGVRVRSNVKVKVSGEQILAVAVEDIATKDTELNQLLRFVFYFKNNGNVIAKPLIDFEILKDDTVVDQFSYESEGINVASNKIEEFEWDTTGQTVGDYVANVKVYLGDELIKEESLDFKILERGSLTAEGSIINVEAPEQIELGEIAKIEVEFMNVGAIDVKSKLKGEVLTGGELVDVIESDEILVKIGKTETLTLYFETEEKGAYLIDANVIYEGKKLEMDSIQIFVGEKPVSLLPSTGLPTFSFTDIVIILIIIVVALIVFAFAKLKNF